MAQLRLDEQKFVEKGIKVVVVGPENADAFQTFWRENQMNFIGLPDPKGSVLKLYGQEVNLFKLGRMPAQVFIDHNGLVRLAHYGHSMSDIPQNDELFDLIAKIG